MKDFASVAAVLACAAVVSAGDVDEHSSQTHPLLSGSVCRVRDSLDFLNPSERAKVTFKKRIGIAKEELEVGPTCHITNGDEENVPDFAGQFHKSLPHDDKGQVIPEAYEKLLECVFTNDINVCDKVPSGAKRGGAPLVNPIGGTAFQVDGADSDNIFIETPDALLSEELAAQQTEVYWMALARDVAFSEFATNDITRVAAENLQGLPAFNGLNIPRGDDGKIDPVRDLFRTTWPGVTAGPVVSQFLLSDFEIDGIVVEPKQVTLEPRDYMTSFKEWLNVQNGDSDVLTDFVPKTKPLFIRNGRDLAAIAFLDLIYSESIRAAFILFKEEVLANAGPYDTSARQTGFATFGEPHILTALAASSSATRHAWYAKWQVHRVLRPEAYGGLVHNTLTTKHKTPLPKSLLKNTELLNRVESSTQKTNGVEKTFLLPMAVAEGSPVHPAYPSGHAINLGAFVTTLKAFVGFERGQRCFPKPVVATDDGKDRIDFVPTKDTELDYCIDKSGKEVRGLTYEGELNKMASNVIIGRSHLGVHYRMDGIYGAMMGEAGAIRRLQQELGNLPEVRQKEGGIPAATYKFRLYSGKMLELFSNGLFRLDGKLCRGPFTGDDFCIEEKDGEKAFEHLNKKESIYYSEL